MNEVKKFLATKAVRKVSAGKALPFDRDWGISRGEYVDVSIRRADLSDDPVYATKKTCIVGHGPGIYLLKNWGFEVGELLTFSVERRRDAVGRFEEQKPERVAPKVIDSTDGILPVNNAFDAPDVEDLVYDDMGIKDKEGDQGLY